MIWSSYVRVYNLVITMSLSSVSVLLAVSIGIGIEMFVNVQT